MLGNNIKSEHVFRASIPLFKSDEAPGASGWPGVKYFFPELPQIDNKFIVGIEAHLSTQSALIGDIPRNILPYQYVTKANAQYIFLTFYDQDGSEKMSNVPLFSLFPNNAGTQKRVHPYIGKIKTRKCFAYLAGNVTELQDRYYISLTFYYN